jgi:hypothetical protein
MSCLPPEDRPACGEGRFPDFTPPIIFLRKHKKNLDNLNIFGIIITILIITTISKLSREDAMVTRKNTKKYKTSDICNRFDISRATLFRWESEGLLAGVERDWRGWRVYNENNLKAIEKIMKGKAAV